MGNVAAPVSHGRYRITHDFSVTDSPVSCSSSARRGAIPSLPAYRRSIEMASIALSSEQISQAPPEVRRWLEQQIVGLLNATRARPAMQPPEQHLVGCDLATARGILSLIGEILPVVTVFFELAREPAAASAQGLRALRLDEMARQARLHGPEQVAAC